MFCKNCYKTQNYKTQIFFRNILKNFIHQKLSETDYNLALNVLVCVLLESKSNPYLLNHGRE